MAELEGARASFEVTGQTFAELRDRAELVLAALNGEAELPRWRYELEVRPLIASQLDGTVLWWEARVEASR